MSLKRIPVFGGWKCFCFWNK